MHAAQTPTAWPVGLLFVTLLVLAAPAVAQRRVGTERYVSLGGGWVHAVVADAGQSANRFSSGFEAFEAQAGLRKRRPRSISEASFTYSYAPLTSARETTVASYDRGDMLYRYLTRVHRFERRGIELFVGGEVNQILVRRSNPSLVNNSLAFESISSLGLAVGATWPFKLWQRDWQLEGLLTTPLVAWVARPRYALSGQTVPFATERDLFDYLGDGELMGPGRIGRATFAWALAYPLANGNALALTYSWDFYRVSPATNGLPVSAAQHSLGLRFRFRF